jgi:thiol-disulfide isomerase/thioredoxin
MEVLRMRRGILCCLLLACVWTVASPIDRPAFALCVESGTAAPDFTIEDINENPVTLSDHRGKVVFLAFWASWCPRCMEELAFLQGLYTGMSKDLVVLAINQETQGSRRLEVLLHQCFAHQRDPRSRGKRSLRGAQLLLGESEEDPGRFFGARAHRAVRTENLFLKLMNLLQ